MPDKTPSLGILNLGLTPYDDEYLHPEFLDKNLAPFAGEINAYIKEFDPKGELDNTGIMAYVKRFMRNKHDQQFGAGIDRNKIDIQNAKLM